MSLHPRLLGELLEAELAVARARLGPRIDGIHREGHVIRTPLSAPNGSLVWLTLSGADYDAEPFSVTVTDEYDSIVPAEMWPTGLMHSVHPALGRPFACVQGCAEFYIHPSHLQDRWDASRTCLRLAELLDHLLRRAGRP